MFFLKALLVCAVLFSSSALAHEEEYTQAMIVEQPYAFSTIPNAKAGAAFMRIKNTSEVDDKLIEAKGNIADIIELHENMIDPDDGTMMMRKIKNIEITAGGEAVLEPKGNHIMFINLSQALEIGYKIPLTLVFEKAGEVHIIIDVIAPGTTPEVPTEHDHDHSHH